MGDSEPDMSYDLPDGIIAGIPYLTAAVDLLGNAQ